MTGITLDTSALPRTVEDEIHVRTDGDRLARLRIVFPELPETFWNLRLVFDREAKEGEL